MKNQYNFDCASAFPANVNCLPAICGEIETVFNEGIEWESREAVLCAVDLRSESPFAVSPNAETIVEAVEAGGGYVVQFRGAITQLVFPGSESVTLSFGWCEWYARLKSHANAVVLAEAGSTITVTDAYGRTVYPNADGSFALERKRYIVETSLSGHSDTKTELFYQYEPEIKIFGQTALGGD